MNLEEIGNFFLANAYIEIKDFGNEEIKRSLIWQLESCIAQGLITYDELEKYWLSPLDSNQNIVSSFINEIKEWEVLRREMDKLMGI